LNTSKSHLHSCYISQKMLCVLYRHRHACKAIVLIRLQWESDLLWSFCWQIHSIHFHCIISSALQSWQLLLTVAIHTGWYALASNVTCMGTDESQYISLYTSISDQVQPHLFYKCNPFLCCKLGQLICCGTTFHSSPNYNHIKVSDSRHCTQELLNVPLPLQ